MMQPPPRARTCAIGALALGCAASILVEYPGTLVYDSLVQLLEGRTGIYDFWHPPVMSWLLGLSDRLGGGAAVFMTAQTLVGFSALAVFLLLPRRSSRTAAWAALFFCLLPQLLMYQGYVLKDVLLADAVLAGFAALGLALRPRPDRPLLPWLAVSALFFVLAGLARQNGILFLPFAAAALAALPWRKPNSEEAGVGRFRLGAWLTAALFVGAVLTMQSLVGTAIFRDGDNADAVQTQFKILRLYDLTGMTGRRPDMPLAVFAAEAPDMDKAIRSIGVRRYTPTKNDTLWEDAVFRKIADETPAETVTKQWWLTVRTNPAGWLIQRAQVFGWLFWPSHIDQCHPFYVGVHGANEHLKALHMSERIDARDWRLWSYADRFKPVFSHALFAVVAAIALVLCLCRRRTEDFVVAGMLGGTLAFVASFFVISIACDYRYLYELDLSALAAALYWLSDATGIRGRLNVS